MRAGGAADAPGGGAHPRVPAASLPSQGRCVLTLGWTSGCAVALQLQAGVQGQSSLGATPGLPPTGHAARAPGQHVRWPRQADGQGQHRAALPRREHVSVTQSHFLGHWSLTSVSLLSRSVPAGAGAGPSHARPRGRSILNPRGWGWPLGREALDRSSRGRPRPWPVRSGPVVACGGRRARRRCAQSLSRGLLGPPASSRCSLLEEFCID